jgi:hypothetical protein
VEGEGKSQGWRWCAAAMVETGGWRQGKELTSGARL